MVEMVPAHLVLTSDNKSWIIEKMANRIAEFGREFGFDVSIGENERTDAAVNHWMSYAFANVPHNTPATMLITHLDDPYKIRMVKNELNAGVDVGITLSSHTRDMLVKAGASPESLAVVVPGHDFAVEPKPIVIGLTTRLYRDGRKGESMLVALAKHMRLDAFRFEIFGAGWEGVIPYLEAAGATVAYWPGTDDYRADYTEMMAHIPGFDYYLYLGKDEGSLGTLDALAAGVRTIITPQGFHVDLPHGITHSVWSQQDLEKIFAELSSDLQNRIRSVEGLSWRDYAERHAIIWRAILEGRRAGITDELAARDATGHVRVRPRDEARGAMLARLLSPYRIRSALSHVPMLKRFRRRFRRG